MTTSTASTRLLKIVRLRPDVCPFLGKASASRSLRVRPTTRISPVSMRSFGRPWAPSKASPSDMPVQHHPQKFYASIEQSVGKTPGDALRSAGRVYDEQD